MRILHAFSFFILFINLSCKKDGSGFGKDNGIIQGHVSDFYTKAPIPQARVFLFSKDAEAVMYIYKQEAATFTDNSGAFSFKFNMFSDRDYMVKADKQYYDSYSSEVDVADDNKKNLSLSMQPYGWVVVHVKYIGNNDEIVVDGTIYIKAPKDSSVYIMRDGNQNQQIVTASVKNSVITGNTHSIFMPALDTVSYYVEY